MTVPHPILLWPIQFASTTYDLEVTSNGTKETLTFPPSGSLTDGRNYWMSGDAQGDADGGEGGVGDLLAILEACLESHSEAPSVTVSLDADLMVSISSDQSFTIHWSDANTELDHKLFGMQDAALAASGAGPYTLTAGRRPFGYWRPRQPWALDSRNKRNVMTGVATSISGLVHRSRLVDRNRTRRLTWSALERARVLEEYGDDDENAAGYDTTQTDTFEYMWRGALTYNLPVRVYADDTDLSTAYGLYLCDDLQEPWDRDQQYLVRWSCSLSLREYQAPSTASTYTGSSAPIYTYLPKSELAGTREPTTSDNTASGYAHGSFWHYAGSVWVYDGATWNKTGSVFNSTVRVPDNSDSPSVRYLLNADLVDSGPNALADLTYTSPSDFCWMNIHGMNMLFCTGDTGCILNGPSSSYLEQVGDMSVEFWVWSEVDSADATPIICAYSALGESTATNTIWEIRMNTSTQAVGSFHEYSSSGTNVEDYIDFRLPTRALTHVIVTRDDNGAGGCVYTYYLNGVSVGSSGTLTSPTGGTSGSLTFFQTAALGAGTAAGHFRGAISGFSFYGGVVLSAAQVLARYRYAAKL